MITPSLSISICLNVLTFCRISSSVYLRMRADTVSRGSHTYTDTHSKHSSLICSCDFAADKQHLLPALNAADALMKLIGICHNCYMAVKEPCAPPPRYCTESRQWQSFLTVRWPKMTLCRMMYILMTHCQPLPTPAVFLFGPRLRVMFYSASRAQ